MKALRKVLIGLVALDLIFIGYSAYQRHQNRQKPCVPFHQGMTLGPGQCITVPVPQGGGYHFYPGAAPGDRNVNAEHPKAKL